MLGRWTQCLDVDAESLVNVNVREKSPESQRYSWFSLDVAFLRVDSERALKQSSQLSCSQSSVRDRIPGGQLGQNDKVNIGDAANELGDALPAIALGSLALKAGFGWAVALGQLRKIEKR